MSELRVQTDSGLKAVSTSVEQWIDSFDDGDLSEYWIDSDSAAHVGVSAARSYEGANSLRFAFDTDQVSANLFSTSGLSSYPSQGDTFEVWFYPGAFHDRSIKILFGVRDTNNHYQLVARQWYSSSTRDLRLKRNENGNNSTVAHSTVNISDSTQWLRYVIDWGTDGSIIGRIDDSSGTTLVSVNTTDDTFADGGIGFGVYNGVGGSSSNPTYFDAARIL